MRATRWLRNVASTFLTGTPACSTSASYTPKASKNDALKVTARNADFDELIARRMSC